MALIVPGLSSISTKAAEGIINKRVTCYTEHGVTASGCETHYGICAGRKEDLGKVAALYTVGEDGQVGEFVGYYEFRDTGAGIDTDGDGKGDSIKKGLSIDIWQPSYDCALEWVQEYGDYLYIKYIDAQG